MLSDILPVVLSSLALSNSTESSKHRHFINRNMFSQCNSWLIVKSFLSLLAALDTFQISPITNVFSFAGTTIITITLIAYNRYKLVLDPGAYTELYTKRNIFIMLLVAWLVPVACLTPAIIGIWGTFGYVPMLVTCNLLLDHHSQLFKIFLMVVRAGLPCGLIVYFYARIYVATTTSHRRLHRNNRTFSAFELSKHRNSRTFSAFELSKHKQEMHMTRMMLIIFLVFIISYFPCTITGLIDWSMILSKHFHMFCQISIYLGSAINPLVYGLMNSQFRQAYTEFICCFKREASKYNATSTKFLRSSFLETNKILEPTESMPFTSKRLGSCTKSWFSKYHGTVKSQSMEQDIENSKDNSSSSENTPNLPLIEQFW